jgi:hypothetical protein
MKRKQKPPADAIAGDYKLNVMHFKTEASLNRAADVICTLPQDA